MFVIFFFFKLHTKGMNGCNASLFVHQLFNKAFKKLDFIAPSS